MAKKTNKVAAKKKTASSKTAGKKPVKTATRAAGKKKEKATKKAETTSVATALKKMVKKVTDALKVKPRAKKTTPAAKTTVKQKTTQNKEKTGSKKTTPAKKKVVSSAAKSAATLSKKALSAQTTAQNQPVARSASFKEAERTSYSDAELEEFRQLINEKLATARKELKYLQEQITRTTEIGDTEADTTFSGLEDGTGTMEREYLNQMASRLITYIGHLEKALVRIENKTYGICRETGKLIPKERLRAVPHATLSIEAKMAKE